jgi:long-chain acyl-CoA synthetase
MLNNEDVRVGLSELHEVILLKQASPWTFREYEDLIQSGKGARDAEIATRMGLVDPNGVCNLQFTSGTTGTPKAAMLTHKYSKHSAVIG